MRFPVCGVRSDRLLAKIPNDYYQNLNSNIECSLEEAQSIYNKFRALAPNGKLTFRSFQECLGLFGTLGQVLGERIFRAFDLNNDDYLDFVEFSTSLLTMTRGSEAKKLALSYRILHPNPANLPNSLVGSLNITPSPSRSNLLNLNELKVDKSGDSEFKSVESEYRNSKSDLKSFASDDKSGKAEAEEPLSVSLIRATRQSIINTTRILTSNLNEIKSNISGIKSSISGIKPSTSEVKPELLKEMTHQDEDGIEFEEFVEVVRDIELTKSLLVCREPKYYTTEEIQRVFEQFASTSRDGTKRLSQSDYINAVYESSEFLELLGISLSQYAMETVTTTYKGVNTFLKKINTTTRSYINRTHVNRKNVYKYIDHGSSKRGLSVHFGHESWNHVLDMMIGLSISARHVYSQVNAVLSDDDYNVKLCFHINENSNGLNVTKFITNTGLSSSRLSDHIINHNDGDTINDSPVSNKSLVRYNPGENETRKIVFKEYAPMVFHQIRLISGLTEKDYLESVSPEQIVGNMVLGNLSTMSELVSEGKSGSLFYYTINGRLILKTITKRCAKFVKRWLKCYFAHLEKNTDSILTRFCGLFSIENRTLRQKVYFIVMNNVFYSRVSIHRRYDLKGSWVGRRLEPSELKDHTVALKDIEFNKLGEQIHLGQMSESFLRVLSSDVNFLRDSNILDYSLLLGIHYRAQSKDNVNWDGSEKLDPGNPHTFMSDNKTSVYYVGIVDVLTTWNLAKRLEHVWRFFQTRQHQGVSCVNPVFYSSRFIQSITNHLK
uniref:1-phosphatidylinositol-4-phosphate 5-kinase or 1-phosphatidylinositol-5-phosphate 4-kinase, putative n=1 Tax=Theileria annulata TaxID=5874 RepID=A0A3B0MP36_THEAN